MQSFTVVGDTNECISLHICLYGEPELYIKLIRSVVPKKIYRNMRMPNERINTHALSCFFYIVLWSNLKSMFMIRGV